MLHVANDGDLLHGIAQREWPQLIWLEQRLAAFWPHFPQHICLTSKGLHHQDVTYDLPYQKYSKEQIGSIGPQAMRSLLATKSNSVAVENVRLEGGCDARADYEILGSSTR